MTVAQKRKPPTLTHNTSALTTKMIARKVHRAPLARTFCENCTNRHHLTDQGLIYCVQTSHMANVASLAAVTLPKPSARSRQTTTTCSLTKIIFPVLLYSVFCSLVDAHGYLELPPQRGIIGGNPFTTPPPAANNVPASAYDYKCHFPAGDKADKPGSAINSQIQAGGARGWTPYEPTRTGFVFRSGPCGDLKGPRQDHMKGGDFYYPPDAPQIVAEYEQGGILSATVTVIGHHNGFFEFTLCDVSQCGGEISEECLRNSRVCRKLLREPQPECETGTNMMCGPIDTNYPTRFYVPCRQHEWKDTYGNGLMNYRLPADMHCSHCVLQWYWVAANFCNPPGILQYFRGPKGPKWGDCPGEGEARGGYRPWGVCSGSTFPEEYYTCADVTVKRKSATVVEQSKPTVTPSPTPSALGENPVKSLKIFLDGKEVREVKDNERAYIKLHRKGVALEAHTESETPRAVYFHVPNSLLWTELNKPFVFGGNTGTVFNTWKNPVTNKWFTVSVTAEDKHGRTHWFNCELFFA